MDSTGSKIWHIVDKFSQWASSPPQIFLEKYEDEFNEPVKLKHYIHISF